jgi:hypothetical protein
MSETLRKIIELAKELTYMEVEGLRSVLEDINWRRKKAMEQDINSTMQHIGSDI